MHEGSLRPTDLLRRIEQTIRAGIRRSLRLVTRRRAGRLRAGRVSCSLGSVIDLSGGGLRLLGPRRLTGEMDVELWDQNRRVVVPGCVVWSKRLRNHSYEIGLEFGTIPPDVARKLSALATSHRDQAAPGAALTLTADR